MLERPEIYTIGHSTVSVEAFVMLLKKHSITAIADVRSTPYSRYNPQFNKEALAEELKSSGIKYIFMGDTLGARPANADCYDMGQVNYAKLAAEPGFKASIERLQKGAQNHRIALVCAEKDPLDCHRTILVAEELVKRDARVLHILHNGAIEEHDEAMNRLIKESNFSENDLFLEKTEIRQIALGKQEKKIAYREQVETETDKAFQA